MLASMSGSDLRAEKPLNWSDLGVSELPTGTVTLLLADVEGSTQLWETQPEAMTDAVARLDRALSDLVDAHSGVRPVEQGEGDSFVVAFARATDAVACAPQVIGMEGKCAAQAFQGDASGARTTADEALERASDLGEYYDQVCYGCVVVACLADGDAVGARRASEAASQRIDWQPLTTGVFVAWAALAELMWAIQPPPAFRPTTRSR